ncbi:MAG: Uncharacterised protein [SAR116 cluster bacterium]|nr:MAG: Uncharacterised protein [SAR116 cluster bacterium]
MFLNLCFLVDEGCIKPDDRQKNRCEQATAQTQFQEQAFENFCLRILSVSGTDGLRNHRYRARTDNLVQRHCDEDVNSDSCERCGNRWPQFGQPEHVHQLKCVIDKISDGGEGGLGALAHRVLPVPRSYRGRYSVTETPLLIHLRTLRDRLDSFCPSLTAEVFGGDQQVR